MELLLYHIISTPHWLWIGIVNSTEVFHWILLLHVLPFPLPILPWIWHMKRASHLWHHSSNWWLSWLSWWVKEQFWLGPSFCPLWQKLEWLQFMLAFEEEAFCWNLLLLIWITLLLCWPLHYLRTIHHCCWLTSQHYMLQFLHFHS